MESLLAVLLSCGCLIIGFYFGRKMTQKDQDGLQKDLAWLAQKLFDEKLSGLDRQTKQGLESIIHPFKETLFDWQKTMGAWRDEEMRQALTLKHELSRLKELNEQLGKEARDLTQALRMDNKAQGNWGELILATLLEKSGLRLGEEYSVQGSLKNMEGQWLRPDVIIHLPQNKHLIVDSKVTLLAFEKYIHETQEAQRKLAQKDFIQSLKQHIKGLSEKSYHHQEQVISPEFVFLFIPLEGAFSLALELDKELFAWAWEKKIVLVSPTTLMVTLKTVESLWRYEKQNRYALEIARVGGQLHDKFVGVIEELAHLKTHLNRSQNAHDEVMRKLQEGRGNLFSQMDKLKELGVKAEKSLHLDS